MVIEFDVSFTGVTPDNSFVGTIYKSSNNAYQLNLTFDREPAQIYYHYLKPDGDENVNGVLTTIELLIDEELTEVEGELQLVFELRDGVQKMFTKPIYLEIRE